MYKFKITQTSILMMVSFKGNSRLYALGRKKMVSQYFFIHFTVWYGNCPVGHNMLGETGKRLCKDAGIEGQFTNHSLRTTTATGRLQKEIPDKFVMERTEPRDVRSVQKYQRPDTSSKKVRLL